MMNRKAHPGRAAPYQYACAVKPNQLIRLIGVPVPPMLERALGYQDIERYIGFYAKTTSEQLHYSDGYTTWHINQAIWDTYRQHFTVAPYIAPYDFDGARHGLLLDRRKRILWVGPTSDVKTFLKDWQDAQRIILQENFSLGCLNSTVTQLIESIVRFPAEPGNLDTTEWIDRIVNWLDMERLSQRLCG